jgi:hypothetical protein
VIAGTRRKARNGRRREGARRALACWVVLAIGVVGLSAANATSAGAAPRYKVPRLGHVFTIVLENTSYEDVVSTSGRAAMPFLTGLTARGVTLDAMFATGHVSLDNYIALTSGQPPNALTSADCFQYNCVYQHPHDKNVGDQLQAHDLSWKAYMEGMPTPCAHGVQGQLDPYLGFGPTGGYATRHNPFMYYSDVVDHPARCDAHDVPYTNFTSDLAANKVPNYSLIVPNTCDDAHNGGANCGLAAADAWLSANVPPILNSPAYARHGVLIITFDESKVSDTRGCCKTAQGGRIFTLVLSPLSTHPGTHSATSYDDYSLLRTVQDGFGLGCLHKTCNHKNPPLGPEVLR